MKKFFVLILAVLTAFGMTACGISRDKEQSAQPLQDEGEAEITQPQPSENTDTAKGNDERESDISANVVIDEDSDLKEIIRGMSLKEKAGQMVMAAFRTDENEENISEISQGIKDVINEYNLCGIVVFGENIQSEEQLKIFINDAKSAAKTPIFVGIDEEGGKVSRIAKSGILEDYNPPSAQKMAENDSIYKNYSEIAQVLSGFGINLDFAPVADINTNPDNIVIGDRAFGSDAKEAAQFVGQAVCALKEVGVASVIKHFPGHGDTKEDSHEGAATASYDYETLISREAVTFEKGIENGADMVMVAHILTPNLSENDIPASMNPDVVTGILREDIGFDGVVITDALDMGAISEYYSDGEAAVTAIKAGCDILLMPKSVEETVNAIVNAVENGEISQYRIDESLLRILKVKKEMGILE